MADQYSPQEIQRIVEAYMEAQESGIPISQDLADAMKDASIGIKGYTATLRNSVKDLKQSAMNLGSAMIDGASGASVYSDTIVKGTKTASNYFRKIPIVGEKLAFVTEWAGKAEAAIAQQADALFKSYQDISRSGIALGMNDAFKNLQDAGYTMKEIGDYGALMKENSNTLATLGGTTAQGAEAFSKAVKNIHNSELETKFMRMGMTVNDINSGMANYIKQQQLSGSTLKQDDKQLAASAAEFMVEQDKLTKITGLNADQQNKIYESALAQEQFAAKTFQLQQAAAAGDEQAKAELKRNKAFVEFATAKFGPEIGKNAQLYIAGAVNSEGYQQFQRAFSETADYFDKGGTDIGVAQNKLTQNANTLLKDQSQLGIYAAGSKLYGNMSEISKGAAASMIDYTKANKDAAVQQDKQITGADSATANMVSIHEDQRDMSKTANLALNKGVPLVTKGLAGLSGIIQQASSVLGQLAGKEGQVGGGTTLLQKVGIGGAPAAGAGGAAPAPVTAPKVTPISPPGGGAAAPTVDSVINFGGNTGDKNHFQQLNPTVLSNFVQMATDYFNTTGKKLQVNSAFRSVEEQAGVNSGNNPKAAPGKSLHNVGKAVDINSSQVSDLTSSGLLGKYGFGPLNGDPPHIQMPSAAMGGVLSGPSSGYQATLHGNEAVVPLSSGKSIPIKSNNGGDSNQTKLLTMELSRLDSMLSIMTKQNDISHKILQKQS